MKRRVSIPAVVRGAIALVAAAGLPSLACSPAKPKSAEDVVKRMSDRLAAAQSFSFATQEKHQRRRGGAVVDMARSRSYTVKRPDAIAFKTAGGEMGGGSGSYDGKSLTLVFTDHKAYARVKMPASIDDALDRLEEHFQAALPVGDVMRSSPYDALVGSDMTGRYVGREKVGASECDHVAFTHARVDFDLWVAASGEPTPCRLSITTKGARGPLSSDVTFADWNLAAAAPASAFHLQVPPDYERLPVAAYEVTPPALAAAPSGTPQAREGE